MRHPLPVVAECIPYPAYDEKFNSESLIAYGGEGEGEGASY